MVVISHTLPLSQLEPDFIIYPYFSLFSSNYVTLQNPSSKQFLGFVSKSYARIFPSHASPYFLFSCPYFHSEFLVCTVHMNTFSLFSHCLNTPFANYTAFLFFIHLCKNTTIYCHPQSENFGPWELLIWHKVKLNGRSLDMLYNQNCLCTHNLCIGWRFNINK